MKAVKLTVVSITLFLTSLAFLGAVEEIAWLRFVLPSLLLGGVISAIVGRESQWRGLAVALVVTALWSIVVNVASGNTVGPAARSAAIVGVSASMAVTAVRRSWLAGFVGGVVFGIFGALYHGAAGETMPIVLSVSVFLPFAMMGMVRDRRTRKDHLPWLSILWCSLAVSGSVVVAMFVVAALDESRLLNRTAVVFPSVAQDKFAPPWGISEEASSGPLLGEDESPSVVTLESMDRVISPIAPVILKALSLLVGITLMVTVARALVSRLKIRVWRRRRAHDPRLTEAITAAWGWTEFRLRSFGIDGLDEYIISETPGPLMWRSSRLFAEDRIQELASLVRSAIFMGATQSAVDVRRAWELADTIVRSTRRTVPRSARIRAALALP